VARDINYRQGRGYTPVISHDNRGFSCEVRRSTGDPVATCREGCFIKLTVGDTAGRPGKPARVLDSSRLIYLHVKDHLRRTGHKVVVDVNTATTYAFYPDQQAADEPEIKWVDPRNVEPALPPRQMMPKTGPGKDYPFRCTGCTWTGLAGVRLRYCPECGATVERAKTEDLLY
jgi:hypothetical protein